MTSTSNFTSLLPSLLIHSPNRTLLPGCCEDGEVTITRCSEAGWALQSMGRQEQTPVLDSGPLPCFTPSRESQTLPGPAGTTRGSGWEGKLCGPGEESGRTAWAISLRLLAKVFLFSPGPQVVTLDKGLGSLGPGQSLHWGKDRALQEQQGQSLSCLLLYPGTACGREGTLLCHSKRQLRTDLSGHYRESSQSHLTQPVLCPSPTF